MNKMTKEEATTRINSLLDDDTIILVIGIRHGEKDGDVLTEKGKTQATATYAMLNEMGICPHQVAFSGANRTRQMADMAIGYFGLHLQHVEPVKDELFHFQPVVDALFPGDAKAVLDEIRPIKEAGGTLAVALTMSEYASAARRRVTKGIKAMAAALEDSHCQYCGLFASHSPFVECGAFDPAEQAYAIGEGDLIVYAVKGGEIVDTVHIACPIAGKTN